MKAESIFSVFLFLDRKYKDLTFCGSNVTGILRIKRYPWIPLQAIA